MIEGGALTTNSFQYAAMYLTVGLSRGEVKLDLEPCERTWIVDPGKNYTSSKLAVSVSSNPESAILCLLAVRSRVLTAAQ